MTEDTPKKTPDAPSLPKKRPLKAAAIKAMKKKIVVQLKIVLSPRWECIKNSCCVFVPFNNF